MSRTINPPGTIVTGRTRTAVLMRFEFDRAYIEYVLVRSGSDKQRTIKALGVSLSTLKEKLRLFRQRSRRR